MAELQERIQAASSKNAQLLAGLHETDSAPSQLYQQINYLNDLEGQIRKIEKHVNDLKKQTASELKDHKKYSESTFRRFAHKASGRKDKFAEKAAKEEREYFDAIQEQKTGEDQLAYIKQLRAEAGITRQEYEVQAQRHDSLQQELDALYDSIFQGPSPGFPDEDQKENECQQASQTAAQIAQSLEEQKHVLFLMNQMRSKLMEAGRYLDDAHSASQMDLFGGGTLASMQKRNYLERAESSISQVRMLQDQVKRIRPSIGDLGPMNIASGSIWGDVVFDNIFSDMEMHDKIKNSELQVQRAFQKANEKIQAEESRIKHTQTDMQRVSEALQNARKELQKAREQAFARVGAGERIDTTAMALPFEENPSEAPPAYSA